MKLFSCLFIAAIVGFLGYSAFDHYYWGKTNDSTLTMHAVTTTSSDSQEDAGTIVITNDNNAIRRIELKKPPEVKDNPFSILMLGVDTNSTSYGRSDTIMVGIVDPENETISMLSIPRDTRVFIPSLNSHDKIAHTYIGGIMRTKEAVEHYLDIPIDYYAVVDFKGFKGIVDLMGGVEIDVEKNLSFRDRLTHQQFYLSKGVQTLNGTKTLNYARFRSDGEGDFGRNRRQQQVVRAIIDQSKDFRNIPKIKEMYDLLEANTLTNLSFTDIVKIVLKIHDLNGDNIERLDMDAYPKGVNGVSYVVSDDSELKRVQSLLKERLKVEERKK